MAKNFAWPLSAAVMVCALAWCTSQESRWRKDDRIAYAKICVDSGGRWQTAWVGGQYCQYPEAE